jgi:hypothetical protein
MHSSRIVEQVDSPYTLPVASGVAEQGRRLRAMPWCRGVELSASYFSNTTAPRHKEVGGYVLADSRREIDMLSRRIAE